jgi:hypothetical protein
MRGIGLSERSRLYQNKQECSAYLKSPNQEARTHVSRIVFSGWPRSIVQPHVLLFVIERCFLERLPLLTIMAKDDQCDMLTLDQIQEFSRAGAQLLFIVIRWPGPTIRGKEAL